MRSNNQIGIRDGTVGAWLGLNVANLSSLGFLQQTEDLVNSCGGSILDLRLRLGNDRSGLLGEEHGLRVDINLRLGDGGVNSSLVVKRV